MLVFRLNLSFNKITRYIFILQFLSLFFRIIIESCMKVEASNGSLQEDAGDVSFFKDYQKPIFSKMYFILLKIFINK